jgi:hypothetical protein
MPKDVRKPPLPEYNIRMALEYLHYLVEEEFLTPEVAGWYVQMSDINHKPIHHFMAGALVDYFICLSQEPDAVDMDEVMH